MSNDQITITINNKTHQFKAGDAAAMRDLPWPERKQLIDLLENIKQAEYIKAEKSPEARLDASFEAGNNRVRQSSGQPMITNPIAASNTPPLDPAIKVSNKDADDVMQRLILEQRQHQKPIPDKASVIKVMLIVFAVIIALILVF